MSTLRVAASGHSSDRVEALREAMIAGMRERGFLHHDNVERAFRAVDRHLFAPDVALEQIYDPVAITRTKFAPDGTTLSSMSAPYIQAVMLEQAAIQPGDRVLEIGSGVNAALAAQLAGPDGSVTTIDIDPEITDRTVRFLDQAGYSQVTAVCGDGEHAVAELGSFDRILVTAGAWDIPPTWAQQLAEGGRLVVPLRLLAGLTRTVALDLVDGHWRGVDHQLCGFVPLHPAGGHDEDLVELHPGVRLRLGDQPQELDPEGLRVALHQSAVQRWTGVTFGDNAPYDGLHLWLAGTLSGFARLHADEDAVEASLVDRLARWHTPAAVHGDSFAYLAPLRSSGGRHEFGVRGHGPRAEQLAEDIVELARTWDQQYRDQHASIDIYPTNTPIPHPQIGRVIDKRHHRVVLQWP